MSSDAKIVEKLNYSENVDDIIFKIKGKLELLKKWLDSSRNNSDNAVELTKPQQDDFVDFLKAIDNQTNMYLSVEEKLELWKFKKKLVDNQDKFFLNKSDVLILSKVFEKTTELKQESENKNQELDIMLSTIDSGLEQLELKMWISVNTEPTASIPKTKEEKVAEAKEKVEVAIKSKKQEVITKFIDSKKDKRYWSTVDWMGLDEYLQDKYVECKEITGAQDYFWKAVLFMIWGSTIVASTLAFDKLRTEVPDIKDIWDVVNPEDVEVKDYMNEENEKLAKWRLMQSYKEQIERSSGKKILDGEFEKIFNEWYAENKNIVNKQMELLKQKWKEQSTWGEAFKTVEEIIQLAAIPWAASFDLMMRCIDKWMISTTDLVITTIEEKWKSLYAFWINWVWLIGNTIWLISWSVSLDEIAKSIEKLDLWTDDRMLLWGMLYRHGWMFTSLMAGLGKVSAWALSLILKWVETEKVRAYRWWWIAQDVNKQIWFMHDWEKSFQNSWIFDDVFKDKKLWNAFCKDAFNDMKFASMASHHANKIWSSWASWFAEFVEAMKKEWFMDDMDEIVKVVKSTWRPVANFKTFLIDYIETKWNNRMNELNRTFIWSVKEGVARKRRFSKTSYRDSFKSHYGNIIATSKETIWTSFVRSKLNVFTNFFEREKKWRAFAEFSDLSQKTKVHLHTKKNFDDFFEAMNYWLEHAPNTVATWMKNAPVIIVGAEVYSSFTDGTGESWLKTAAKWMAALMPLIWPIWFISEGLWIKDDKINSFKTATIWAMTLGYDSWMIYKWSGWWFLKTMANAMYRPVWDLVGMVKMLGYGSFETARHLGQVPWIAARYKVFFDRYGFKKWAYKTWLSIGKSFGTYGWKSLLRLWALWAVVGAGYYWVNYLFNNVSKEEKERVMKIEEINAKYEWSSQQKLEELYNSQSSEVEKQEFLKSWLQVSLKYRFWLDDYSGVEVWMINNWELKLTMKEMISKEERESARQDIEPIIKRMTWREVKITFTMSKVAAIAFYKMLKEQNNWSDEDAKFVFRDLMIHEHWESEAYVDALLKQVA